jgi:hypothetical protein
VDDERGYREERPLAEINHHPARPPSRARDRARRGRDDRGRGASRVRAAPDENARGAAGGGRSRSAAPIVHVFAIGSSMDDRTSPLAGIVAPDGRPDQSFTVVVSGPIKAIALVSTNSTGRAYGLQRWSTHATFDPHP